MKSEKDIATKGIEFALKNCDLPKNTCIGGQFSVVKERRIKSEGGDSIVVKTLVLTGIEIDVASINTTQSKLEINSLTITGKNWPTLYDLGIGTDRATLFQKLGPGTTPNGLQPLINGVGCVMYGDNIELRTDGTNYIVIFCLNHDKVTKIKWEPLAL